MTKVYGSDHCPVYIDLHEEITLPDGQVLRLKDQLNPVDRPPTTAQVYPNGEAREAPEPPRFATKFLEEFSGRQTTLKSFFGGRAPVTKRDSQTSVPSSLPAASLTPPTARSESEEQSLMDDSRSKDDGSEMSTPVTPVAIPSSPFGLARAAFAEIDNPTSISEAGPSKVQRRSLTIIDVDQDTSDSLAARSTVLDNANGRGKRETSIPKSVRPAASGQTKLSSFFAQPTAKRKSSGSETRPPTSKKVSSGSPNGHAKLIDPADFQTGMEDEIIAQAIAEADVAKAQKRAATNAEAAPVWNNLFAPKATPLCTVHQKPCKDFSKLLAPFPFEANTPVVKIPGPNKGKRFWLCSL